MVRHAEPRRGHAPPKNETAGDCSPGTGFNSHPPFSSPAPDIGEFYQLDDSDVFDQQDGELELYFSGPATGWTENDTRILEAALNLAGLTEPAGRLGAAMAVDILDIVILAPLVRTIEGLQDQIRQYLNKIKGGPGK